MHLRFAFEAAEQLCFGFQPVFHLMARLRTLLLVNRVGQAANGIPRGCQRRFALVWVHNRNRFLRAG